MMRLIRFLLGLLILAAVVAGITVVLSRNPQGATLDLNGATIQASFGALIAGSVAIGILVAAVLLLPGWWAAALRAGRLRQQGQQIEDQLRALQAQYAQLQAAHDRLMRERSQRDGRGAGAQAAHAQGMAAVPALYAREPSDEPPASTGQPPDSQRPHQLAIVGANQPAKQSASALPGSLRVGNIAGIQIDVHVSWLIIVVLLTASLALSFFPTLAPGYSAAVYWIIGLVATLLLFFSVLLHELGHSLVARARGLPVSSITLFIFGGVSNLEQEPHSPGEEFAVTIIGPVISLVLGAIALLLVHPLGQGSKLAQALLVYLGSTNLILGIFNLLPGFPLDGGRVLRSILWRVTGNLERATRWAARVGQVLAFLFILLGVWLFFLGNVLDGIWIGFIGWFLLNAAQSASAQVVVQTLLRGISVAQAMAPPPPPVSPETAVQAVVDGYLWPLGLRSLPVVQSGRLVGMVTLSDILRLPRDQWAQVPVSQVMIPAERLLTVEPRQPLQEALGVLSGNNINSALVVQNGQVVGVLTRENVMRLLDVRRRMAPSGREQPPAQPPQSAPTRTPNAPIPA